MKRCLAICLSTLMLWTATPLVSATYNDDHFDWGEYACPHTQTETVEAVASNCSVQGHGAYTYCVACKLLLDGSREPLPLGDHVYEVKITPADCVKDGQNVYTCSVCGDSYEETVLALGHAYDAVVTAPDCEKGGYTTHTCKNCGDSYVADAVDALGHHYVPLSAEPPTCDKDGFEKHYCTNCGDSYTVTMEATGHAYDAVVTAPDCENSGYTVHTCTVCGHSYADSRVDALGHSYQVTETVVATCVADGKKVYTCARCDDSYTEVIPAPGQHTYDYICDEVCNVCGYIRKDAHAYTYLGTVEPTCGEDGSDGYKCWECGEYWYVILPATGNHTYSGVCDATCHVCGYIRESVVAHNYVLTEDVAVTCTTDGKQVYACQGCGDRYTNTIAAQGHAYHIVITAPTCEQGGYTTHTCTSCGDVCVDNRTPALGHAYDAVATAPTCAADGYTTHTCAHCGDSYVDSPVPATGEHTYDSATDATCNICGHMRPITTPGDIDGNGKLNNRDLGLLQLYLNDDDLTGKAFDETAADLDGNGKLNNRDLGLLQKQLNR